MKNLKLRHIIPLLLVALLGVLWYAKVNDEGSDNSSAHRQNFSDKQKISTKPRLREIPNSKPRNIKLSDNSADWTVPQIRAALDQLELDHGDDLQSRPHGGGDSRSALLYRWHKLDHEGIFAWVLNNPPGRRRNSDLGQLIEFEARIDVDSAWKRILEVRLRAETSGQAYIDPDIFSHAMRGGAEKYIEFCKEALRNGFVMGYSDFHGQQSSIMDNYPGKFDFEFAMNAFQEMRGTLINNQTDEAIIPDDILRSWTEQDPAAAYRWLQSHDKITDDVMKEFIHGYATHVEKQKNGGQDLGVFAGDLFRSSPDTSKSYKHISDLVGYSPAPAETLDAFLQQVSEPGDRKQHLFGLVKQGFPHEAILRAIAPEDRLDIFEITPIDLSPKMWPSQLEGVKRLLKELGHTDDEISAAIQQAQKARADK